MKKLFFIAATVLAFIGCKDEGALPEEPKADEISVLPESKDFDRNGGSISIMITSTGEWTLSTKENATYDWVSTDKTNGVDGDLIKFTVAPNETEEAKSAYYVFTCGKAIAEFKITSFAGEIQTPSITVDESEIVRNYKKGTFVVVVKCSEGINHKDLKAVIPAEATWLKYAMTLEGSENGTAEMQFEYEALDGFDAREVAFTINYENESIPMKMKQMAKPVLKPEFPMYTVLASAGVLSINVTSNVTYNAEVITPEGTECWLTDYAHNEGVDSWSYSSYDGKREATILFKEANPIGDLEPVVAEVKIVQTSALITSVVNMDKYRAVFNNSESGNKEVLKLGKNMTIEFLLKPNEYDWPGKNAIIGIENRFIITLHANYTGDLRVYYAKGTPNEFGKYSQEEVWGNDLPNNKWTHVAVTMDGNNIKIYQNGIEKANQNLEADIKDIDFTETYDNFGRKQEFAIGYADNNNNYFIGQISEVRIWNKALTSDEINAKDHFYKVEVNSEGLVAYWKMNDGGGSVIKDYTSNGNDLVGQKLNKSVWENADLVWEQVSLPE